MVTEGCMAKTHNSILKVGTDETMAELTIECDVCGPLVFKFPIEHLTTIANACSEAAKRLKLAGMTETVLDVGSATEDDLNAALDARRKKAWLN